MPAGEESDDPQTGPVREPRSLAGRILSGGTAPARRAAEAAGLNQTLETALEEAIVRVVESEATERAVARILNGPVIEQAVAEALRSPAVEQAIIDIVDSDLTDRVWARVLDSDETQSLIEHIAHSPEIRGAIAAQGVGLVDQLGAGVAAVSRRVDASVERAARWLTRRRPRIGETDRVGAVTRILSLALDALVVNIGLVSAGAIVGMLSSFLGLGLDPESRPVATVGATAWFGMASVYLFTFWAISGQTPGMRFLNIAMRSLDGGPVEPGQALRRLAGFWVAVIPFCLGFIGVLLRADRRGFPDRVGRTVVLYETSGREGEPADLPGSAPAPAAGRSDVSAGWTLPATPKKYETPPTR